MNWVDFDSVFRSKTDYSPDQKQIDAVARNRKELGGFLFFDRIWTSIGLKQPQKHYPPKSNADLRTLWQKVARAEVSNEKKQAILLYILKDCRHISNLDTTFAQKVFLPPRYLTLVTGLWELDHLQFSRALEHLTDPSLTPEFADDILLTLVTSTKVDKALAMAYYLTVQPPLAKQETLEAYFEMLVGTSITEAYHFCSKKDESLHKTLFEGLIHAVHEEEASIAKAGRLITLLSIPFTPEEERWFDDVLLHGSGSKLADAKDSVLIHRVVSGQTITGHGSLDRYRGQKLNDMNWDDVRAAFKTATT